MEKIYKPEPGLYPDMPNEVYHETDAISSGFLKEFTRSPAHAFAKYLDPQRERKDKKAWRIGRAWHCALFEPAMFRARFAAGHDAHPATKRAQLLQGILQAEAPLIEAQKLVALPEGLSSTSKEGKGLIAEIESAGNVACSAEDFAFINEWKPKLLGKDVLAADTIESVLHMANIARALPVSSVVFDRMEQYGRAEASIFSEDPETGLLVRIRPDYMLEPCAAFPDGLIIDGKSTTDASTEGFARQVWNLDYGLQAALYTNAYQRHFRTRSRPKFLWLAQEKEAPFAAAYYGAGDDLLAHWDSKLDTMLPRVAQCLTSHYWPAYSTQVQDLQLPVWAQKQMGVV